MIQYLVSLLKRKTFFEVIFAYDIGRAGADLSRRHQPIPDQSNNRHPVDAKAARGLVEDQLMHSPSR